MKQLQQQGSVLLLALLVMSGAVTVGLTVGSIVISELRQSQNLDQAVIAFHAAESGIERALYAIRQSGSDWNDIYGGNPPGTVLPCNFWSTVDGQNCQTYYASTTAWTFSLEPGEVESLLLYDGNLLGPGYQVDELYTEWSDLNVGNDLEPWLELDVVQLQSDWTTADVKTFINKCSTSGSSSYPADDPVGNTITSCGDWVEGAHIFPTEYYVVRIRALYDAVNVTMIARDTSDVAVELPRTDIYVNGFFNDAQQALKVEVTNENSVKDFADFVLYSECDLSKGFGVEGSVSCP